MKSEKCVSSILSSSHSLTDNAIWETSKKKAVKSITVCDKVMIGYTSFHLLPEARESIIRIIRTDGPSDRRSVVIISLLVKQ